MDLRAFEADSALLRSIDRRKSLRRLLEQPSFAGNVPRRRLFIDLVEFLTNHWNSEEIESPRVVFVGLGSEIIEQVARLFPTATFQGADRPPDEGKFDYIYLNLREQPQESLEKSDQSMDEIMTLQRDLIRKFSPRAASLRFRPPLAGNQRSLTYFEGYRYKSSWTTERSTEVRLVCTRDATGEFPETSYDILQHNEQMNHHNSVVRVNFKYRSPLNDQTIGYDRAHELNVLERWTRKTGWPESRNVFLALDKLLDTIGDISEMTQTLASVTDITAKHYPALRKLLTKITSPRAILDATASIGNETLFLAETFPEAKIISIEKDPLRHQQLAKRAAEKKNITPLLGSSVDYLRQAVSGAGIRPKNDLIVLDPLWDEIVAGDLQMDGIPLTKIIQEILLNEQAQTILLHVPGPSFESKNPSKVYNALKGGDLIRDEKQRVIGQVRRSRWDVPNNYPDFYVLIIEPYVEAFSRASGGEQRSEGSERATRGGASRGGRGRGAQTYRPRGTGRGAANRS